MNFEWMSELKWKAGYPMAVAVTVLGCVLVYRRLRRAACVSPTLWRAILEPSAHAG
jgi:magnesium transporter